MYFEMIDDILDETCTPVARARLLSSGVNTNNRLEKGSIVIGDQACMACGNCVDACPVVQERHGFVFVQNLRTSMALESMVGEECRRCYRCIKSCPQVDKELKEYTSAFRRGEKIVHLLLAALVILLAMTGISMSHYKGILPDADILTLSWIHRILAVALICTPLVYYILDKKHLVRLIRRSFSWGTDDRRWIVNMFKHIWDPSKNRMPLKTQFNAGQKTWYLYTILIVVLVMSVSGLVKWIGIYAGWTVEPYFNIFVYLHMAFAFITDSLILVHFYLKYLRNWLIMAYEIMTTLIRKKHLIYSALYKDKLVEILLPKDNVN